MERLILNKTKYVVGLQTQESTLCLGGLRHFLWLTRHKSKHAPIFVTILVLVTIFNKFTHLSDTLQSTISHIHSSTLVKSG